MTKLKWITVGALIFTFIGLFFEWTRIEFVAANGLEHWSGIYIFLISLAALFLVARNKNKGIVIVLLVSIPVLTVIQFLFFAEILNISSMDFGFSAETVQLGFFITLLAGIVSVISYSAQWVKERTV